MKGSATTDSNAIRRSFCCIGRTPVDAVGTSRPVQHVIALRIGAGDTVDASDRREHASAYVLSGQRFTFAYFSGDKQRVVSSGKIRRNAAQLEARAVVLQGPSDNCRIPSCHLTQRYHDADDLSFVSKGVLVQLACGNPRCDAIAFGKFSELFLRSGHCCHHGRRADL